MTASNSPASVSAWAAASSQARRRSGSRVLHRRSRVGVVDRQAAGGEQGQDRVGQAFLPPFVADGIRGRVAAALQEVTQDEIPGGGAIEERRGQAGSATSNATALRHAIVPDTSP